MSETNAQQIVKKKKTRSKKLWIIFESFTFLAWIFMIFKLLIFDLDLYLINEYAPNLSWLLRYKFFIMISIVTIIWLSLGSRRFSIGFAFVVFYPFFFLFWRMPHLLLGSKSWFGIFAAIGIILSFIKSLKINFAIFVSFCLACLLILISKTNFIIIISIVVLLIDLFIHFIRRFSYVFKPLDIFSLQTDILVQFWENAETDFRLGEEIKQYNVEQMSEEQKTKWSSNLQSLLIFNRICYFLISKLRGFQRSRIAVLYYMINIVYTVAVTVFIFAFINLALAKIDHSSFTRGPDAGLGSFTYYSFNTLFINNINDFYPITGWAKALNCTEILCSFLVAVILFFLFTTIIRERHREDIDKVILRLDRQGNAIEKTIKDDFNLTVEEAIKEVEKMKGSMLKIIRYFALNIDK